MSATGADPPTPAEIAAATGAGVRVLILDSGVETGHEALAGGPPIETWQVVAREGGRAFAVEPDPGGDVFGHGTAVASVLRRHAPGARIESLRVLGGDLRASSRTILAGLEWALDRGFDVLNCSFGSTAGDYLAPYKHAVDRAFCENALVVAACSNQGFRLVQYPASFPSVLSTDCGPLAGLALERRPRELVEFVASGIEVRVAWKGGGWRASTGSSFAAPHLAALCARIRELRPAWNACEVKAALYRLCHRNATVW